MINQRRDIELVRDQLCRLVATDVPPIGQGSTSARWLTLYDWARRHDVSVARLAEAHLDAHAILAEAVLHPSDGLYGVWASGPGSTLQLADDGQSVTGEKQFCSGVGVIDRALVTAASLSEGPVLLEIDVSSLTPPDPWKSPGLGQTLTGPADLGQCPVLRVVGTSAWYLERPGFWHGAIGPAACWAGAAAGLVDVATGEATDDPHRLAGLGDLMAMEFTLSSLLAAAGRVADGGSGESIDAECIARACRRSVERTASAVSDVFSQIMGPRAFVTSPEVAQRHADLHLYLRQHHGPSELETLGRMSHP